MAEPRRWNELARPGLRPGLHVVRRDDRHLQIGLDDPDRLVLPDVPGLHAALARPGHHPRDELLPVLDALVRDGWVVDLAGPRTTTATPVGRVSLVLDAPFDEVVPRACAAVRLTPDASAPIRLLATLGEPRRADSDALMREDRPHVWLAALPGRVRIGPYVEPGRTACLRCLDAHLGDLDPRRATVLHQLEELPGPHGLQPDPCLVRLGAWWAVRDIVRRLRGEPSTLTSATVTIADDLGVVRRDWLRHPHCGCAWG